MGNRSFRVFCELRRIKMKKNAGFMPLLVALLASCGNKTAAVERGTKIPQTMADYLAGFVPGFEKVRLNE